MSVSIKSPREIERMRESCRLLAILHEELVEMIRPGISTWEIDRRGEKIIRQFGCIPSFKDYNGYPASICISVNEEIVHGIPSRKRILRDGDIVSLDAGMIYQGYHSDAARTHGVGEISGSNARLIRDTEECFWRGIAMARPGNHLHDISNAIGDYAEVMGYGVIRELCGHGIGTNLHEDPQIRTSGRRPGDPAEPGMTLAVEPMIAAGNRRVEFLSDGWTVITADHSPAAHYENTILITEGEPEILTLRRD